MFSIIDKNQTLQPPEGYELKGTKAEGSYLRLYYRKFLSGGESTIMVYLTDQGREIARTIEDYYYEIPEEAPAPVIPVGRWFRFKNGFLIALMGLQEMFS